MTLSATPWDWLLEPPREFLTSRRWEKIPRHHFALAGGLAVLAYALGETVVRSSADTANTGFIILALTGLSVFLSFIAGVGFTFQIAKTFGRSDIPWTAWLATALITLVPLHLALPLALICRPLGIGGIFLYEIGKLFILTAVLRRWMWAVHATFAWPLWAAMLLLFTPLIVACIALAVGLMLVALVVLFAMLGSIA